MSNVITAVEQATPERLTDILRRDGVLRHGSVTGVTARANPAFNSNIAHLTLTYSHDATPGAPQDLLLKLNVAADWAREAGESEVAFYAMIRERRHALPMIVPCYDAVHDPVSGDSHLLLLDLSATHAPPVTRDELISLRGVPADWQLAAVTDAISALHAYWWEHSSLTTNTLQISSWYSDRHAFDARVARHREEWAGFVADEGASLAADLRALYERALERLPVLWECFIAERVSSARNLTLVHGDCFLTQFLCPLDGLGQTYLIDFQGAFTDFPTIDLTHLLATFWTSEQRRDGDREERLLARYLGGLRAHGVTSYSWDDLRQDYRLLLIYMIFYPIWDQQVGSRRAYWWPKLRCLTEAYRDWSCDELLA